MAPIPESVDPWRLALSGKEIKGELAVKSLQRLCDLIADDGGAVYVNFHAVKDEQNRVFVKGQIRVELMLNCQLCLQPMTYLLSSEIDWLIVRSEEQQLQELEHYDPVILDEDRFNIKNLIEDELILNLPIAPTHSIELGCQEHDSFAGEEQVEESVIETTQPFKNLKNLLSEHSDKEK